MTQLWRFGKSPPRGVLLLLVFFRLLDLIQEAVRRAAGQPVDPVDRSIDAAGEREVYLLDGERRFSDDGDPAQHGIGDAGDLLVRLGDGVHRRLDGILRQVYRAA